MTVQTASVGTKSDRYDCEVEIVSLGDVSSEDLAAFFTAGRAALLIASRSEGAADMLSYVKNDMAAAGRWASIGQSEAANLFDDPAVWRAVVFLANVVYAYDVVDGQHVPNILNLFKGEITRSEFMEWEALSGLRMLAVQ